MKRLLIAAAIGALTIASAHAGTRFGPALAGDVPLPRPRPIEAPGPFDSKQPSFNERWSWIEQELAKVERNSELGTWLTTHGIIPAGAPVTARGEEEVCLFGPGGLPVQPVAPILQPELVPPGGDNGAGPDCE